jgi:hypothetical protein
MFTHMDFHRISSALEEVIYKNKEMIPRYQQWIQEATTAVDTAGIERSMRGLNRCEKNIEENRALVFKTEAVRRWTEAEKILFPDRFSI